MIVPAGEIPGMSCQQMYSGASMRSTPSPDPYHYNHSHSQMIAHVRKDLLLSCHLVLILAGSISLSACRKKATPSPTPVVMSQATAAAVPTSVAPSPTPMPFLPALQYYLSPRSRLIHTEEADVDDDGVLETIVLYQDTSSFSSFIRGMVAEPPTPQTPTPDPTSEDAYLSDVYWLGPGAADELFGDSWDSLEVRDINGDGRSELLLWGKWDANTHAVHVYQKGDLGYESLLSLRSNEEIIQQLDQDGNPQFNTVELAFPRSGILQRTLAHWNDGAYRIEREMDWSDTAQGDIRFPESTILQYYSSLSDGDLVSARQLWSPGLRERAGSLDLQNVLERFPSLQIRGVSLLVESAESARASLSLAWTDPDSGTRVHSDDEIWDLVSVDGEWVLDRLNSTPARVDWQIFTTADGLSEDTLNDLELDSTGRLWIATVGSGLTVWDGTYWSQIQARDDGLASNATTALQVDSQGRLWIGTANGVTRWDGMRWLTTTTADGLPADRASALAIAQDQTVWAATEEGIAYLEGDRWKSVSLPKEAVGLTVNSLASDATGDLWVAFSRDGQVQGPAPVGRLSWAGLAGGPNGGSSGGLAFWTGSRWQMADLSSLAGDLDITALDLDPDGLVWAASEQGAIHGSADDWKIHYWPDSLNGSVGDVLLAPDGYIFFATDNGLLRLRDAMPLQVLGGGH